MHLPWRELLVGIYFAGAMSGRNRLAPPQDAIDLIDALVREISLLDRLAEAAARYIAVRDAHEGFDPAPGSEMWQELSASTQAELAAAHAAYLADTTV